MDGSGRVELSVMDFSVCTTVLDRWWLLQP